MKALLFMHLYLFSFAANAQVSLKGNVQMANGETVPGISVFIKGTYDGTTTDEQGKFEFTTSATGNQVLVVQGLGFKSQEITLTLDQVHAPLSITIREAINELTAVTISAGAMEASDEKKAVVLRTLDIVTTPSAMGDIIGAFQTLPGTSTVGNDGRLFVRGGDASETAIFIDGMRVGNAFGSTAANVPTRTRFNPNLFKGSFFSTGGYSAEFGQALSSALTLNTIDLPIRSQGDISIMSIGMGFTQTLAGERNSLTGSFNFMDLSPYQRLINQNFDWERSPYSWDAEISGRQRWGKNGMVKAYLHTSAGGMKLWQPQPGMEGRGQLVHLQNKYTYAQTSFRQLGKRDWSYYGGLSYSNNADKIKVDAFDVLRQNRLLHGKAVAIKSFSDKLGLKTGLETFVLNFAESLVEEDLTRSIRDEQVNLFSEADYYFNNQLILRAGLRSGYSSLGEDAWLDPRVSLAYKFPHEGQISLAAGTFSQMPEEQLRVQDPNLQNTKASHLILNYFLNKSGRTFRAEVFYKGYDRLITFEGLPQAPLNPRQEGSGYAQGVDAFYRDRSSIKNTDFWVTYSFVDSKRQFAQFQTQVQPHFAPKHNASIVVKHMIPKLQSQLGASYAFNDGYPFTDLNEPGEMNSKTKSFQDLSLSWSYLPKPNLIIHLACSNVLGRDNVFGQQFSMQPNAAGSFDSRPIRQGAPRFIFLGIFLTLSKDKTANQLNNL